MTNTTIQNSAAVNHLFTELCKGCYQKITKSMERYYNAKYEYDPFERPNTRDLKTGMDKAILSLQLVKKGLNKFCDEIKITPDAIVNFVELEKECPDIGFYFDEPVLLKPNKKIIEQIKEEFLTLWKNHS